MADNIEDLKTKTHRFKKFNEPKHKNHEKKNTLSVSYLSQIALGYSNNIIFFIN